jgi:hypothetical protein
MSSSCCVPCAAVCPAVANTLHWTHVLIFSQHAWQLKAEGEGGRRDDTPYYHLTHHTVSAIPIIIPIGHLLAIRHHGGSVAVLTHAYLHVGGVAYLPSGLTCTNNLTLGFTCTWYLYNKGQNQPRAQPTRLPTPSSYSSICFSLGCWVTCHTRNAFLPLHGLVPAMPGAWWLDQLPD